MILSNYYKASEFGSLGFAPAMPEPRWVKISRWKSHRPSTNSGKEYSMLPGTSRFNVKLRNESERLIGVHQAPRTFIIFAPSQVGAVFCFKSLLSLSRGKRCSSSYIFQWSITSFPLGLASVQDLFHPFPVCSLAEKHKLGQPDAGRGRTKGGEAEKWDTP